MPPGPSQNRARRFPPLGSSAEESHGARAQIWTQIRGGGSGPRVAWHESYDGDRPTAKPRQILDIADAHRILAEITRIVKRIEDVSAASAISRADFYRVMTEMGRVVDLVVEEPAMRERIHDGWMEIRLA